MKLTFKITSAVFLSVVTLLLFFGFFIIEDEKNFLKNLQNKQGKAVVNIISISIVDAVLLKDYPAIDTIVENISKSYKNIYSISVVINNKVVTEIFNKDLSTHKKVLFKSDVIINDEVLAKVVSEISNFENTKLINKRIENIMLIISLISLLLILIVILIVKYLLIDKINFISKSMQGIEIDNLNNFIQLKTNDEFEDLADNINQMTKQLDDKIKDNKTKTKLLSEQSRMAGMGEMIGNIAHQWRQPLSVITTGVTGIKIQKEFGVLNDEDLLKTCQLINKNAQYLSQTIDDFRNYIKGDSKICKFNIKENINSFLKLVDSTVKTNDIKIILEKSEDIILSGYPNELQQCFINIFHNSNDAFKQKNQIEKYFFIEIKTLENDLIIKLKDNAGGISDEILPKIFDPYFTTKHQSLGTGLGLSMTYDLIVNSMKGLIEARNVDFEYEKKVFIGTEFTIKINLTQE